MDVLDLATEERRAVLDIVLAFADADGISDVEAFYLKRLERAAGDQRGLHTEWREAAGRLSSRRSKVIALVEVLTLGWIDDRFSPEESAFADDLVAELGLEEERVAKVCDWVFRRLDLLHEAEGLWS